MGRDAEPRPALIKKLQVCKSPDGRVQRSAVSACLHLPHDPLDPERAQTFDIQGSSFWDYCTLQPEHPGSCVDGMNYHVNYLCYLHQTSPLFSGTKFAAEKKDDVVI